MNVAERPNVIFPLEPASERYLIESCPFPTKNPDQYPEINDGIEFKASKHLAFPLEVPSHIKVLKSDPSAGIGCVKLVELETSKYSRKIGLEDLAYTAPFRVLSDEGVKAFNQVIEKHEDEFAISTARNPKIIRSLGYISKFVRDLNESNELLDHLSTLANVSVAPHPMVTNYSQINFGEPPADKSSAAAPADIWHLDSVDYVLVILLTEGFEGGELLVSNMDPTQAMARIRANDLPDELTSRIKYPKPGYGIFMQGSRIAHAVAPLTGGNSTRITSVSAYSSRDAFRIDRPSIYNALAQNHTKDVYDPDYTRNIAWRCKGKLEYLVKNPQFDNLDKSDEVLKLVIDQLVMARKFMKGEQTDDAPLPKGVKLVQGGFKRANDNDKEQTDDTPSSKRIKLVQGGIEKANDNDNGDEEGK